MSYPDFQLEEFYLERMRVDWHEPQETVDTKVNFSFDYDVAAHKSEKGKYRLAFQMTAKSATSAPVGYEIDCSIVGIFKIQDGVDPKKVPFLVRVNGCTMLYGILRGQLAGITGSFPGGKFTLPAYMMQDVVKDVERIKAEKRATAAASAANQESPKPTSKKSKASK
jgi:preprotein translocase subunit SecB